MTFMLPKVDFSIDGFDLQECMVFSMFDGCFKVIPKPFVAVMLLSS